MDRLDRFDSGKFGRQRRERSRDRDNLSAATIPHCLGAKTSHRGGEEDRGPGRFRGPW
jgi:hypothetical protein